MQLRLLVYGMESSGASTFCLLLGQVPGSVSVVDLWSQCVAPPLRLDVPTVIKATATQTYRVSDHIASFNPHRTIMFLRDPVAVYCSLRKYPYANYEGTVEQKLSRFDEEFGSVSFDLVLRYEDFIARDPAFLAAIQNIGWPITAEHYRLDRSVDDILEGNFRQSPWLRDEYERSWAFGNIKGTEISRTSTGHGASVETVEVVRKLAPRLSEFYENFQP
jgi:hypothetical protein